MGLKGNQKKGNDGKFVANPVLKPTRSLAAMTPTGDIARVGGNWYEVEAVEPPGIPAEHEINLNDITIVNEAYDVYTEDGMEVTVYPIGQWHDFPHGDGGVFRFCPHQEAFVAYNDDVDEDDGPWYAELAHIDKDGDTLKTYGYGDGGETYEEFRNSIGDAEELTARQRQCEECNDPNNCKECGFGPVGQISSEHAPQCSHYSGRSNKT